MRRVNAIGLAILCVGTAGLTLAVYLHTRAHAPPRGPIASDTITIVPPPPEGNEEPTASSEPGASLGLLGILADGNQLARRMNDASRKMASWGGAPASAGAGRPQTAVDELYAALQGAVVRQCLEVQTYIAAGDRALDRMDLPAAADCFAAARLLDPNDLDAAKGLAIALTAAQRNEEAAEVYSDLLRRQPEDGRTKYNLAVALAKNGRTGEAQQLLAQLVEKEPGFLEAWYNLATLYTADAKLSRAREAWQKVADLAPKMAYPWMKLGEVLMDLGDANAARGAFAEASKRDSNDPRAYMNQAAAAARLGSYGQAVLATERAAALAPDVAGIWASLGNLRIAIYSAGKEEKFLSGAVSAWEKSLSLDANQPDVKDSLDHFGRMLRPITAGSGE